jgi:hypothetical protein
LAPARRRQLTTPGRESRPTPPRRGRVGDRAIGIVLGLVIGILIVIAFVFLGSQETIDDPSIDDEQPAIETTQPAPETAP